MTAALYKFGRGCARHRFIVIVVWVVAVVALAAVARGVGEQTSDNLVLPGTDSQRASDTLSSRFPTEANGTNPIAFQAPPGGQAHRQPLQGRDRQRRRCVQEGCRGPEGREPVL